MEDVGNLSVITQYGYSPNVQVPVAPPQPVPTATPDTDDNAVVPLDSTNLLLSFDHLVSPEAFGEIKVDLSADAANTSLQGAVVHVYMNLPNGGRVLVAKYNENTSTRVNQTIRVPRLPNTSFTVVAHSGSALTGSDIVVPNLQIGSTVSSSRCLSSRSWVKKPASQILTKPAILFLTRRRVSPGIAKPM